MKTGLFSIIAGFLLLVSLSKANDNHPIVEKIILEEKTFEEQMQETELYKKTVPVEDTIMETHKLIQDFKNEKIN